MPQELWNLATRANASSQLPVSNRRVVLPVATALALVAPGGAVAAAVAALLAASSACT